VYVIDATGHALGRLASRIALVLRGKHKATYTPNVDMGDFVIVLNAGAIKLTGTSRTRSCTSTTPCSGRHPHPAGGRTSSPTTPSVRFREAVWA